MPVEFILRDKKLNNVYRRLLSSAEIEVLGDAGIIKYADKLYTYSGLRDGIWIFVETSVYEMKDRDEPPATT